MNKRLGLTFRLLHWGIATIVFLNAFILNPGKWEHRNLGYLALGFVLIRIFINKKRQVDHYNHWAKTVYWLIWFTIISLGITGYSLELDRFFGNQTLQDIHEILSNVLIGLVVIHLFGVFHDAITNKRKTWLVMFTGEKR